jgi:feruloyl esterase
VHAITHTFTQPSRRSSSHPLRLAEPARLACEVEGIAAPQIQFDVLLPTKTWRQRYLQTGCEAYCGSADADPQLRVDFGYRSEHVLALVAKRLIALYYGQGPRYSYFDGCSSPRD